ncbi:MAG: nucleotidyltransferase domain-containing protein [Elusimicrobiota bacterium]
MNIDNLKNLKSIFASQPKIKLVYFFGSKAVGKEGPLSDYDFAVYLEERDKIKLFDLKFVLADKISRQLKTDKVDLVILNLAESPELKYNIIKDGKLIYEVEPFRVLIEPRILNEYFDFHSLSLRHGLTKAG